VPTIERIVVADDPERWRDAGFDVEDDRCRIGRIDLALAGSAAGRRIAGWSLRGVASTDLDGLPTERADSPLPEPARPHPNGAVAVDHVVAFTPALERSVQAAERAGLLLRRIREGPTPGGAMRQAFFRVGEAILELIEHPPDAPAAADPDAPARFWGLALLVEDLDRTAAVLGDRLGEARDAVQEGRRIATLRREAGLAVPLAFMTAPPAG
jgi:hypothetical protein